MATTEELENRVKALEVTLHNISEPDLNQAIESTLLHGKIQMLHNAVDELAAQLTVDETVEQGVVEQTPGPEDWNRIFDATCNDCGENWRDDEDPPCTARTTYEPSEYYDKKVVQEVYWTGSALRYIYDWMRFRGGRLVSVMKGVKGGCQDDLVVCATDCVTLEDPECG